MLVVKAADRPPKGPASAFLLFYAAFRKDRPIPASREENIALAREAGSKWRELSEQEKEVNYLPFTNLNTKLNI